MASVAMMESTHHWQGDDVALVGGFHGTRFRTILVEGSVRTVLMIIAEVVRKPLAQVVLVQYDHVVQTFAADGTDQTLDKWILVGSENSIAY